MRLVFSETKDSVRRAAILIDRDGVINCLRPNDYVLDWSQFIFTPGIRSALGSLSLLNVPIVVISNQAGVGKGLLKPAVLREITIKMHEALLADGASIMAYYYCTHTPADGCNCRKPKPGMLFRAAAEHHLDLSRSVFIGDSESDVLAARAAGCQPVLFGSDLDLSRNATEHNGEIPRAGSAEDLFQVTLAALRATGDPLSMARDSVGDFPEIHH